MNIKMSIAAIALALSAPAFAAGNDGAATVKYGDLNLASASGMAQLGRRVHNAAEQVCGYLPSRGLSERQRVSDCQDEVVADANAKLEPVLSAASGGNEELALNLVRRAR